MFIPNQHKRVRNLGAAAPDFDIWPYSNAAIHPDGDFVFFNYLTYTQSSVGIGSVVRTQDYFSQGLVKINPVTGRMDQSFQENFRKYFSYFNNNSGIIFSIAIQNDGKIIVAGGFLNLDGVAGRSRLARFNLDLTVDESFCINASDGTKFNSDVVTIDIQSDGKIVLSGAFTNYGGVAGRDRFIRLNSDGTVDTTFCINAVDGSKFSSLINFSGYYNSVTVQSNDQILVAGSFTNYGGVAGRNRLIRLNNDGTLDTTFCANASDGTKFNSSLNGTRELPDGRIIVYGNFTNYGGISGNNRVIMLNSDGTADSSFNAAIAGRFTNAPIIATVADGHILFCQGSFLYSVTPSITISSLIRISYLGVLDDNFAKQIGLNPGPVVRFPGADIAAISKSIYYDASTSSYYYFAYALWGMSTKHRAAIKVYNTGILDRSFYIKPEYINDSNNIPNWNAMSVSSSNAFVASIVDDDDKLLGFSNLHYPVFSYNEVTSQYSRTSTPYTAGYLDAVKTLNFISKDGEIIPVNNNFLNTSGISVLAKDSLGRYYLGGAFQNYGLVIGRSRFVRLNSDFTVDDSFCANSTDGDKFSSTVSFIKIQGDGKIILSGNFINYGGVLGRNRFIRLNEDGTVDTSFCNAVTDGSKFGSSANSVEFADNKMFVGGNFTNYAGVSTDNFFLVFDLPSLTINTVWRSLVQNMNNFVTKIIISSFDSDKIYIIGQFTNFGGVTDRNRVIRFSLSSISVDNSYVSLCVDGNKFINTLRDAVEYNDGSVLFAGSFSSYNASSSLNRLVKLDYFGYIDPIFNANATGTGYFASYNNSFSPDISALRLLSNQEVLLSGSFDTYKYSRYSSGVLKLDINGNQLPYLVEKNLKYKNRNYFYTQDSQSGIPPLSNQDIKINCCVLASDGGLIIGTSNKFYMGNPQLNFLVKFKKDGSLDEAFNINACYSTSGPTASSKFNLAVLSLAIQGDGKILVGGDFLNYDGVLGRNRLIRLNEDGTLDTAFSLNANAANKFNNSVRAINILSDNSIVVGGDFTNFGGLTGRNRLVKLNQNGTTDTNFCINAVDGSKISAVVRSIKSKGSSLFVAGNFINYGGTTGRNRLLKFDFSGILDVSFVGNSSDGSKIPSIVYQVDIDNNDNVIVGGSFSSYAGDANLRRLIRLDSSGLIDSSFSLNLNFINGAVWNLACSTYDDSIICSGSFVNYNNESGNNYLLKLNSDGNQDLNFNGKFVKNKGTRSDAWICENSFSTISSDGAFVYYDTQSNNTYVVGSFPNYYIDFGKRVANILIFTREGKIY